MVRLLRWDLVVAGRRCLWGFAVGNNVAVGKGNVQSSARARKSPPYAGPKTC